MNQEIKAAIARISTMPPAVDANLDPDFEKLLEGPHTLATLGAALSSCPHPARCVVDGRIERDGQVDHVAWCAACGAMAIGIASDVVDGFRSSCWERPAIVQQYTPDQFVELERIEHVVRLAAEGCKQAGDKANPHDEKNNAYAEFRELENALRTLVTLSLFAEMKRAGHARNVLAMRAGL